MPRRFSHRSGYRERWGSVYVLALAILVLFISYSGSLLVRGVSHLSSSERLRSRDTAFHLADAGVDQAARNFRTSETSDDVLSGTFPTGQFLIDNPPVALSSNPTRYQVTTHGMAGSESRHVEAVIELAPTSIFQYALFGDQLVTISGSSITDSYDSTQGPYQPDVSEPGYNRSQEGDVGTNATSGSSTTGITISGNLAVNGQVIVGPNVAEPASVVTINGGSYVITGDPPIVSAPQLFPMPSLPDPTMPPISLACPDYSVPNDAPPLTAGATYCFRNLTVTANRTLTATGPGVTVYLTGALSVSGNSTVGVASQPGAMVFLMRSQAGATIEDGTITGSTQFYGAIYSPVATVHISGDAKVFGSVIAKKVKVSGNAEIHYDTALGDTTTITNFFETKVVSWQEL